VQLPLVYLGVRAVLLPRAPEVAEQGGSFGVRDTVAVVRDDDAAEPAEVVAAMKVETDSLAHVDPFKLLNRGLPSGKFSVGSQTLAVIGATFGGGRTGFYLLANESGASPRKIVSAEALLDDKCAN